MSMIELHGLGENAALELAERRRGEALKKLNEARAIFDDWDKALSRIRAETFNRYFARSET